LVPLCFQKGEHMELDGTINRVKQLIQQREQINIELEAIFGGIGPPTRRPLTCDKC
jgi:hypothetical protein